MKSIKYITVLAIIALVTLYYFNNGSSAEIKKIKPINQVSFQTVDSKQKTVKSKNIRPLKASTVSPDTLIEDIINKQEEEKPDPNLDYVTAYRDWKYFV